MSIYQFAKQPSFQVTTLSEVPSCEVAELPSCRAVGELSSWYESFLLKTNMFARGRSNTNFDLPHHCFLLLPKAFCIRNGFSKK
jgi:hypothetical protein